MMQKYRYRNMTKEKMRRKVMFLRNMHLPNHENGATRVSWCTFWQILFKLQLTRKLHHYY